MTYKKYHGWFRLGLVISVLWLLGAIAVVSFLQNRMANDFNSTAWETRDQGGWRVVGEETFLFVCTTRTNSQPFETWQDFQRMAKPECNVKLDHAALILIGPIVIAWLLVPLAVWTVLWVRKGFHE